MRTVFLSIAACAALLTLANCGGGNGDRGHPVTHHDADERLSFPRQAFGQYSIVNLPAPASARHMPIYSDGRNLAVGVDQSAQHLRALPAVTERGATAIRYGRLADGVGQETLARYMADAISDGTTVMRYSTAPEVRVIGRPSARNVRRVEAAVQLVNAALPAHAKMRLGAPLPDRFVSDAERHNSIRIEFLPCSEYYDCSGSGGTTWNRPPDPGSQIRSSYIQMNLGAPALGDDRRATILLAHEIMHALGFYGGQHVSPEFDSIMLARGIYRPQGIPQPLSLLYPVDREALRALYSRLDAGDSPDDFGPWASTSLHIAGVGKHAAFGVRQANGYGEPWAYGPIPDTTLANNRALTGRVTWAGTLLGFTPNEAAVAGDAAISVELATLTGTTAFMGLYEWKPGTNGARTEWGDGDLAYTIAVDGNTFRETAGDDGRLTGIFTGAEHEGAAGTLERADLTAAFGASR